MMSIQGRTEHSALGQIGARPSIYREFNVSDAGEEPPPSPLPNPVCPPQLVSAEEYDGWLQRGLRVAESRCEGSYHCATADCPGWCVYEDTVNVFHCPVCRKHNCLLCKVPHFVNGWGGALWWYGDDGGAFRGNNNRVNPCSRNLGNR